MAHAEHGPGEVLRTPFVFTMSPASTIPKSRLLSITPPKPQESGMSKVRKEEEEAQMFTEPLLLWEEGR